MGGGIFNVHHAAQAITHAASSAGNKALELANPIPKPAEGRSRGDQARTILRKAGSTVTHVGNKVGKAGDVISTGVNVAGLAASTGEVVGIGLTFAGFPEVGIPLEEASVALGESDMLAEAGVAGTFLQNAGSYVVDTGKTMRNMAKGAEKGVRKEHAPQLAVTAAGYEYRNNMHKGPPQVPDMTMDTEYSGDRRAAVYTHDNDNSVFITYNGTDFSNADDVKADAYIVKGEESKSDHFKYADRLFKEVKAKYPDKDIHLTGHSLGGAAASYVGCKNQAASVTTFNRGGHFLKSDINNQGCTSQVTNYKTRSDPLSTASYALPNQKLIVLKGGGGYEPHGMHNFNVV